MNKINLLGKYSLLIFYIESVATIIWSDDSKKLKIKVRTIDIVMKSNSFIQIVFLLINLVPMRPVYIGVSIFLGLCYGIWLGNSWSSCQPYCCSTSMIKSNTKVNYKWLKMILTCWLQYWIFKIKNEFDGINIMVYWCNGLLRWETDMCHKGFAI